MEVTYVLAGLVFAWIVEEWVWDYAITVTLVHIILTTAGSGLVMMIFGGQLLAYRLFRMHYSAFLEYAEQPYETTSHRKYPRMMKLGKGLELGLMTMKKGESSRFLLQPQYAYGEMGCFPLIPPASTILFEVQVFDFLDMAQAHHFFTLEPDERNAFPLSVLASVADTLRYYANYCFRQGHFDNAKWRYKKLRLESPQKALQYANRALAIDPQSTKALFRCGQAYMDLHEYEQAQRVLIMAQAKKPDDCQINGLLLKVAM
ncbi:hypothetical protein NHX12_026249 [Muraenolepis orangiensis]|uniref:peptidylprolyl isomerase n=1 Tax=Muraenolepis orangiensis TaxID=630683 RepID=A0A9Q0IQK6_9TELE|nr:hypothetical protein NHX12_026249 [Muraenolepis orangiensis]